jgi:riboflavin kinase/FMN adenylyltransferase
MKDGVVVSSTYIRKLIENGDMERANELLGHPHMLADTVHSGYHLGTKMGTPTINMYFPEGVLIPRRGVYAAKVVLEDGSPT